MADFLLNPKTAEERERQIQELVDTYHSLYGAFVMPHPDTLPNEILFDLMYRVLRQLALDEMKRRGEA